MIQRIGEYDPAHRGEPIAARITGAATLLPLILALAFQWRAASILLGSGLVGDEPKHFTSGVMVFDYLRRGFGTNPMRFAESFEAQYPRLAIGHWPPMYYAVQGLYYFLAGPSIRSAQVLSALMAALLAVSVFLCLRARTGARIALVAAACLLAAPLIQDAAWHVMSDLLTGLFLFPALLAFARLLDEPRAWKAAVAFAVCAVAAVLTKGSAWALGPFFLLAPWLCRRPRFFRSRWFFGALAVVILAGSSFYVIAQRTGIGYPTRLSHYLTVGLGHRLWMLGQVMQFAPVLLIGLSLLGFAEAWHARWRGGDESAWTTVCLAAGAWILSQIVFLAVLPMTPEARVLLPSLAPATILTARFLLWLMGALRLRPALLTAIPVVVGTMLVADSGAIPAQRIEGYRQAADAMPYPADGALILMAGEDWRGEGAMIAERLSQGSNHRDVILRGTHMLNEMDAPGVYRPRFQNAEAVRAYLLAMPVRFVVLNRPPYDNAYQYQVESAVVGDAKDFRLLASVPVEEHPGGQVDELRIYENLAAGGRHPAAIQTPLGFDAGRRVVEYRWP